MNARIAFPLLICAFCLFFSTQAAIAQMSSTNYRIDWDTMTSGGDDGSSSSSYILRDSVGGSSSGSSSSSTYTFDAGYRGGVYDRVVDFALYLQDRSSQVAATALSSTTVSVTSTSGFSTGDMIAIVQNEGASQSSAIGEVTAVGASSLTVDALTGDSLTIDGSNDVVYRLDASSVDLGTLTDAAVSTAILAWQGTADVDDGYTVYLMEDTDLTDGSNTIDDVTDGAVSAGVSEYGARSSDATLSTSTFDTEDTAITSTPALVGSQSSTEFSDRGFVTLKVGVSSGQASGSYTHTLTVLYVGNY